VISFPTFFGPDIAQDFFPDKDMPGYANTGMNYCLPEMVGTRKYMHNNAPGFLSRINQARGEGSLLLILFFQ
jgi:hypothetical protein